MKQIHRSIAIAAGVFIGAGIVHPEPASAQAAAATQTRGSFSFMGYTAPVPKDWEPQPPGSSMRVGQYRVPAAKGSSDAEAVLFYFGKGQGGSVEANVERWVSQFSATDGRPVSPHVEKLKVNGLAVTTVELSGNYARGAGMGPQGDTKANQTLLVAVIETPDGNITLQLYGPKETVAAHRKGFEALVRGFKKAT